MKTSLCPACGILCGALFLTVLGSVTPVSGEPVDESRWHFSVLAGRLDYEGEEAVNDTAVFSLHAGYDIDQRWTLEGVVFLPPRLEENFRTDWSTRQEISRLEEQAGSGIHNTHSARIGLSGLYHFSRGATLDPYLLIGGGMIWYGDSFEHSCEGQLEGGGGLLWRLGGQLALRTEFRGFYVATARQFNSIVGMGLTWTPGGSHRTAAAVIPPPAIEAPKFRTLENYELHIEFPEGSDKIPAQYSGDLDVVGKKLAEHPEATALIESHVDQKKGLSERSAANLTAKRARAVLGYLAGEKWKIVRDRMTAVGCGFSKPKEKADPETGSSANRRIEINILVPAGSGNKQTPSADSTIK